MGYLKPGQNREARYDKIIYSKTNILAANIKLIGTEAIGEVQDEQGVDLTLLPSDHFGLKVEFKEKQLEKIFSERKAGNASACALLLFQQHGTDKATIEEQIVV